MVDLNNFIINDKKILSILVWYLFVSAIGYGETEGGTASDQLLKVNLNVIDATTCAQRSSLLNNPIFDGYLCVDNSVKDTCQGDSGGPLFHEVSFKHLFQIFYE